MEPVLRKTQAIGPLGGRAPLHSIGIEAPLRRTWLAATLAAIKTMIALGRSETSGSAMPTFVLNLVNSCHPLTRRESEHTSKPVVSIFWIACRNTPISASASSVTTLRRPTFVDGLYTRDSG